MVGRLKVWWTAHARRDLITKLGEPDWLLLRMVCVAGW
jgi:hypothetical protein